MKSVLLILATALSLTAGACGKCEYRDDLATDAAAAEKNFKPVEALADKSFNCYAGTSSMGTSPGASADSLHVSYPAEVTAEAADKDIKAVFEKAGFKLAHSKTQDNGVTISRFESGDVAYVASLGRVGKQPRLELFHLTRPKK